MSTAISFLSGKGGSGKTALALSMADLLSRCGIRTLLIDCDLSTNGAAYFYEKKLKEATSSFKQLLTGSDSLTPLNIRENLDFIPSVLNIGEQDILPDSILQDRLALESTLHRLFDWAKQEYEIVLFDCQAGYTNLLPSLLPHMDVDLFVLEPDAISAAALVNLYKKAISYFGHAKLYQVFNKASPEEFEVYSNIGITGTFYTNIGTLLFDWNIRRAFSLSRIPDVEHTSRKFGKDLCIVCEKMLPETGLSEKVEQYALNLQHLDIKEKNEKNEELKRETERKYKEIERKYATYLNKKSARVLDTLEMIPLVVTVITVLSLSLGHRYISDAVKNFLLSERIPFLVSIIILLTIIAKISSILSREAKKREERKELREIFLNSLQEDNRQ